MTATVTDKPSLRAAGLVLFFGAVGTPTPRTRRKVLSRPSHVGSGFEYCHEDRRFARSRSISACIAAIRLNWTSRVC
jgi:hypothetical protein